MKILPIFLLFLLFGCNSSPKKVDKATEIAQDTIVELLDTMQIWFSGDFMQHSPQFQAARVEGGYDYDTHLRAIAPLWLGADYSVINLETTLSEEGGYSGYPMFCSPAAIAPALKRAGITHVAMANNHVCDRGLMGVQRTIAALDSAQLEYFGVGFSDNDYAVLGKGALRVGVLNGTYGTNGLPVPKGVSINSTLDTSRFERNIRELDSLGVTHKVAYLHWGEEYQTSPSRAQKALAMWLRVKGVDVVVGSHPHVAQPIDTVNSVVYSLGNFVSNQTKINTNAGYSVLLTFIEGCDSVKIDHTAHYVDISGKGVKRYSVLPLSDTLEAQSEAQRRVMRESIERVEKIVRQEVRYD